MSQYQKWNEPLAENILFRDDAQQEFFKQNNVDIIMICEAFNGNIPKEKISNLTELLTSAIKVENAQENGSMKNQHKNALQAAKWGAALLQYIAENENLSYREMESKLTAMGCSPQELKETLYFSAQLGVNTKVVEFLAQALQQNNASVDQQNYISVLMQQAKECEQEFGLNENTPSLQ